MIRLLLTEPFSLPSPVNAAHFDRERLLLPLLAEEGIEITDDPGRADIEIRSGMKVGFGEAPHLPMERVIIVDGEPPQPEYYLRYYSMRGFGAVLCPANLKVCAPDDCAYYDRGPEPWPELSFTPRILQLSTYRTDPVPRMQVMLNGRDFYEWRVLCTYRCRVGLAIRALDPEFIQICGHRWPEGVVHEDTRRGAWQARKFAVSRGFSFQLCWENMEIPYYVTEKLWDPIAAGSLPLYWGPPEMHDRLPAESIIDCRDYESAFGVFEVRRLVEDLKGMSEEEWRRRMTTLREWMLSFPSDARERSLRVVLRTLVSAIKHVMEVSSTYAEAP